MGSVRILRPRRIRPGKHAYGYVSNDLSQGSANRIFVKFEKSCEEMVTFKLVQTICIANVC